MMRWLVPLVLLIACRDTYVLPVSGEANANPLAQAGAGSTVVFGSTVDLDGSGSFDPDGAIVAYTWKLLVMPTGSAAVLSATTESSSSFVVDLVGTYTVELIVRDDAGAMIAGERSVLQVDAGVDWLLGTEARAVDALVRANAGVGLGTRRAMLTVELSNTVRVSEGTRLHALVAGGLATVASVSFGVSVSITHEAAAAVLTSVSYDL